MDRRVAYLTFGLLGPAAPALTQESASQPVRIVITKVDCSRLIQHMPSADVAYQPGVDAQGRAVVPADVPGSGADAIGKLVPDVLEFPININPVAYGARNQAQRDKAAALQGQADTYAAKTSAQAQITRLNTQRTTLTAQQTQLAGERTALANAVTTAQSTLATLQGQVDAGTRKPSDRDYVAAKWALPEAQQKLTAKDAEVTSNQAQLNANAAALTKQQGVVDAAPGQSAQYSANQSAAEAKLAAISSKGLDNVTMMVGTVRYDMAKGTFTFNGEPIGGAEQAELARACQKQGVR
ncbi:MAG TPA: hypothetical protein VL974_02030 [Magnetospirillum sp.]|nr:hypothetical protein [Magnetospirillum sp.]